MRYLKVISLLLLNYQFAKGQDSLLLHSFQKHTTQAESYYRVNLYAESIQELEQALTISKNQQWAEEQVETAIFLAEVHRKVKHFDKGWDLLHGLNNSIHFP
ncbi:MAG: hypothetical protein JKY48_12125 [Flavobacteriales bacterium]|nr:hypothetical protein [Flavobacteriales bacterium]